MLRVKILWGLPRRPAAERDRTKSPVWLAFQMGMSLATLSCSKVRRGEKAVLQGDQARAPNLPDIFRHLKQVVKGDHSHDRRGC